MTVERWICGVCWKSNRVQDASCWKCRSPRELDRAAADAHRAALATKVEQPEAVPDIVVALPVVIFRSYARAWFRGGLGMLAIPLLMGLGGIVDVNGLILSGGLAVGLIVFGVLAGEVSDGMRERELWAFLVGIVLSVVAVIGSVMAFQAFAPGLISPTAVRWGSVIVFGGAGLAAIVGLVLLVMRRDRAGARTDPGLSGPPS